MASSEYHFLMDMDGVVYKGNQPLNGSVKLINWIQDRYELTFLTNNSTRTPSQYVDKLSSIGIKVNKEIVMTAGKATALYLNENIDKKENCFIIGESGLISQIKDRGFKVISSEEIPDNWEKVGIVVVGWDRDFDFNKLKYSTLAIRKGAKFIATNSDSTFPTPQGLIPGAGAIISSIKTSSGVSPTIIGKPNSLMFEEIGRVEKRENAFMVGDRIDTDIKFGKNVGIKTILVETGINDRSDIKELPELEKPDFVFNDPEELYQAIKTDKLI